MYKKFLRKIFHPNKQSAYKRVKSCNHYDGWAKHPAPYPPCGGRFPSTRPQTVLTCLHVYGFPLVTLLFTIVLNHRVAVLTDNQCLAMSFEHQFLPLIIAFQLGESPHMMHDYFSFLTT